MKLLIASYVKDEGLAVVFADLIIRSLELRMKSRVFWFSIICLCFFGFSLRVYGMGGDEPKGSPISSGDSWPATLRAALDTPERVGGCWVNANSWHFYVGDVAALNRFLEACGEMQKATISIQFHSGVHREQIVIGDGPAVAMDWKVSILRRGWWPDIPKDEPNECVIRIEVWTGDHMDRRGAVVPGNVREVVDAPSTGPATRP